MGLIICSQIIMIIEKIKKVFKPYLPKIILTPFATQIFLIFFYKCLFYRSPILQADDMAQIFCSPIILDCFSFIITAVYFTWQAQIASTANFMNDVLKNDRWLPKILTTYACDKCRSSNKWFLYAKPFGRNNPFAEWTQLL